MAKKSLNISRRNNFSENNLEKFHLPYFHLFLIIKLEFFPKFIGILVAHRFSITQSFNALAIVELLLLMVSAGINSFSLSK